MKVRWLSYEDALCNIGKGNRETMMRRRGKGDKRCFLRIRELSEQACLRVFRVARRTHDLYFLHDRAAPSVGAIREAVKKREYVIRMEEKTSTGSHMAGKSPMAV